MASSITIVILLVFNIRRDYLRLSLLSYAVFAGAMFFVANGGQINSAAAFGVVLYYALDWIGTQGSSVGQYSEYVSQTEKVPIWEGILGVSSNKGRVFNTYDPTATSYRRVPRSINRIGGAQFTYSFWIMFERGVNDDMLKGATIFMKGDVRKYAPMFMAEGEATQKCYFSKEESDSSLEACKDYTIACPRVFFLTADRIGVDINTDRKLRHRFVVGSQGYNQDVRKKALSLLPGHFALMTFVFEDNVGINDFERGVRFSFYLNDHLYHTETAEGAIKQNNGFLHCFPDRDLPECKVADFNYFNYALTDSQVAQMFAKGYNTNEALQNNILFENKDSRLLTSAYNKMDMYNYR